MRAPVMYGAGDVRVEDRPQRRPADRRRRAPAGRVRMRRRPVAVPVGATDNDRPIEHELLGIAEESGALDRAFTLDRTSDA